MSNTALVFRALGDPIRVEMIKHLSISGSSSALNDISKDLNITRQGARKHIRILADAHLVQLVIVGRNTQVNLNMNTLLEGKNFIAELELIWANRLKRLKQFVESH